MENTARERLTDLERYEKLEKSLEHDLATGTKYYNWSPTAFGEKHGEPNQDPSWSVWFLHGNHEPS